MFVDDTVNNTNRSFLIDVIIINQDIKKLETTISQNSFFKMKPEDGQC